MVARRIAGGQIPNDRRGSGSVQSVHRSANRQGIKIEDVIELIPCFSAEFNKSNNCYAFVTENGLTPCEPNFMINSGSRAPPGQLKAICLCIKPTHTRLQFHPQY